MATRPPPHLHNRSSWQKKTTTCSIQAIGTMVIAPLHQLVSIGGTPGGGPMLTGRNDFHTEWLNSFRSREKKKGDKKKRCFGLGNWLRRRFRSIGSDKPNRRKRKRSTILLEHYMDCLACRKLVISFLFLKRKKKTWKDKQLKEVAWKSGGGKGEKERKKENGAARLFKWDLGFIIIPSRRAVGLLFTWHNRP